MILSVCPSGIAFVWQEPACFIIDREDIEGSTAVSSATACVSFCCRPLVSLVSAVSLTFVSKRAACFVCGRLKRSRFSTYGCVRRRMYLSIAPTTEFRVVAFAMSSTARLVFAALLYLHPIGDDCLLKQRRRAMAYCLVLCN